jgi:hypothetical protein
MWSVDRLHPSERGHRLLATSCFDLVAAQLGVLVERRPDSEPVLVSAPALVSAPLLVSERLAVSPVEEPLVFRPEVTR